MLDDSVHEPSPPFSCSPADVERWNKEWLDYLGREWAHQLQPHTEWPLTPPLPERAMAMLDLELRPRSPLGLYCDGSALGGKRVMELGCGCGSLGKLLGRYVATYVGTDYSTLALQVARLVSPANCRYVHLSDRAILAALAGTIETVVSRYFWIHQNLELAGWNLDFLAPFVSPGSLVYTDFFWPDPEREQFIVRSPEEPLSGRWPSAMFRYEPRHVAALLERRPFRVVREEISVPMQRRYVVLEKLAGGGAGARTR